MPFQHGRIAFANILFYKKTAKSLPRFVSVMKSYRIQRFCLMTKLYLYYEKAVFPDSDVIHQMEQCCDVFYLI